MHVWPGPIKAAAACAVLALAGCIDMGPRQPPKSRPSDLAAGPSAQSQALTRYYSRLQADLLAQGLLRTDGGGPDTPFTAAMLARDFERIALYDEYESGAGMRASKSGAGVLRRWSDPVRVKLHFGASIQPEQRAADTKSVANYVTRLNRVTGHPIGMRDKDANFMVLVVSEDDRSEVLSSVRTIVPNIQPAFLQILEEIPSSIYCLVLSLSNMSDDHEYNKAIAIIRAEHPDLLRLSCIHEELAQGLGLPNDSPAARPSIFNDDDEFALLTTHDEMLLKILYDRRLRAGMSAEEARPIIRRIARELVGTHS